MPRATINGADLFYNEHGSCEPLLFHHGYTGSHDSWAGSVERLSGEYRQRFTSAQSGSGKKATATPLSENAC